MIDNAAANHPRVSGAVPSQRSGAHAAPGWSDWSDDATMVLPAFVTGRADNAAQAAADAVSQAMTANSPAAAVAAAGHAQAAATAQAVASGGTKKAPSQDIGDRLPSSERNMLIFVATLLALGTIAVVLTMGLGKFG